MPPNHNETHRYLHAFSLYPKVKFELQKDEEQIILVLRAHPITQIGWILAGFISFLGLISLDIILFDILSTVQFIGLNLFISSFILAYMWHKFLLYYYNVGVVTDYRILDIDFFNLLYREISEIEIKNIQDLTSKMGGYFGSLFNYGNLFIQTEATVGTVEFMEIPAPTEVIRIISQIQKDMEK